MVGVSLDLKDDMQSKEGPVRMTQQEEEALMNFEAKANKAFLVGLLTGAGLAWAVPLKMNPLVRMNLICIAGLKLGRRQYNRSLISSVDHILSLHGTFLQRELAAKLARNYKIQKHSLMIPIFSKHFYSEEVYDESSLLPRVRLRLRNFYSDQVMVDDSQDDSRNANPSDSENTDLRSKQIPVNSGTELMMDPLDCVYGYMANEGEIHQSSTSSEPSGAHSRP